ncbi:hypothetical protein [Pedobacter sp.]|uniref:hypothetical protein n=1 Tax=Pedobacter sp. TaxID=1411316 RepID=UPI003D7FCAD1
MAYRGMLERKVFTAKADAVRHWTATIAQIQMLIGMVLYFQSPIVSVRMVDTAGLLNQHTFFRYIHVAMMILAVVLVTVGSAKAKRMVHDRDKYQTILKWFILALIVILIAIPWPFSPFAGRPYLRTF